MTGWLLARDCPHRTYPAPHARACKAPRRGWTEPRYYAGVVLAIDVLGPLAVSVDGRPLELTSPKLRALLVVLAMEAGSTVSVDRLTGALWDSGDQPESARRSVQIYVARLRNRLGSGLIVTAAEGYQLRIDREQVDALGFTQIGRAH